MSLCSDSASTVSLTKSQLCFYFFVFINTLMYFAGSVFLKSNLKAAEDMAIFILLCKLCLLFCFTEKNVNNHYAILKNL